MSTKSSIQLLELPTKLKLHIIKFVGSISLRQTVPLINKEFNSLSKTGSLYEYYKHIPEDNVWRLIQAELKHKLYQANLKVLEAPPRSLYRLTSMRFTNLKEYIAPVDDEYSYVCDEFYFLRDIAPNLERITILCEWTCPPLDKHIAPLISDVQSARIWDARGLNQLFKIPVKQYLIGTYEIPIDSIRKRLQKKDISGKESKIGIDVCSEFNAFGVSLTQALIQDHTELMSRYIVMLSWELVCSKPEHQQLFRILCTHFVSLEYVGLYFSDAHELPEITEFKSKNLETLKLSLYGNINCDSTVVLNKLKLLLERVKSKLTLDEFKIIKLPVDMTVENIILYGGSIHCTFALPDTLKSFACSSCSIEQSPCDTGTVPVQSFMIKEPTASGIRHALTLFKCTLTCLTIIMGNDFIDIIPLLEQLQSLNSLSLYNVREIDEHRLLTSLLTSAPQLSVFRLAGSHGTSQDILSKETLKLLKRFKKLRFFHYENPLLAVSRDVILTYFPTAFVYIYIPPVEFISLGAVNTVSVYV